PPGRTSVPVATSRPNPPKHRPGIPKDRQAAFVCRNGFVGAAEAASACRSNLSRELVPPPEPTSPDPRLREDDDQKGARSCGSGFSRELLPPAKSLDPRPRGD